MLSLAKPRLCLFIIISICHQIPGELDLFGLAKVEVPLTDKLVNVMKPSKECEPSLTIYTNGQHPCKNRLIFEDNFERPFINKTKWVVEQYTPITHGPPDYEFVSYEINDNTLFIKDNKLILNPVPATSLDQVLGTLDLREGCTSFVEDQCFYQQVSGYILPPVKSARISSKFSFTYGKIEIKAKLPVGDWIYPPKLPVGDWIYPQIQLLPRVKSNAGAKLWIAYSRGNSYYIGPNGDIGNTVLFGGLVLGFEEPARSRLTSKNKAAVPYGDDFNLYTLIWEPEKITVLFNNQTYGSYQIDTSDKRFNHFGNEFFLSIGLGVGGINDFPDNYTTNNPKPWTNTHTKQLKTFFDARDTWSSTWRKTNVQLQIDSVKIWSL
ncbi:hypothetical protein QE152_g33533 [Popillia japonica]|uniref:GH16 domain-containing protein n=1 Tax=Popillia japonica TaxID=7064 RepID=A0AAW1IW24_POPJA